MESVNTRRRLIVNADDFGRSHSINEAIVRAHREGILTSASLMVNEPAASEAVALARENPRLGVGLHLTVLLGHSALSQSEIPGLVDTQRNFPETPIRTGMRYFFKRELHAQLRKEIHAQFAKFRETGLPLDHVNGHLHMHMHPVIIRILMDDAKQLGIRHIRLTREPFSLDRRLARGNWWYRFEHAMVYHWLAARAKKLMDREGLRYTQIVYGLLQNARVDEAYVLKLLPHVAPGDSELYSHPSLDEFRNEFDALISPRVKQLIRERNIELIRYQDL